jgi:hypothetical protein
VGLWTETARPRKLAVGVLDLVLFVPMSPVLGGLIDRCWNPT